MLKINMFDKLETLKIINSSCNNRKLMIFPNNMDRKKLPKSHQKVTFSKGKDYHQLFLDV